MNNKEVKDVFYKVPEGVDYADILEDVDLEDVPEETIQKLTSLLDSDNDYIRYQASRLLTIWGIREGFDILTQMFSQGQLEWMISHRLYGYDDTNRIILDALKSYWATQSDRGNGDQARKDIFPYVCQIIDQAGNSYYHLSYFYYLVEDNYWRIHDTLKLFLKVEPDYVTQLLKEKQKSLGDFGIEDKGERN